jgi:glycosyltransferase involved in cell wall biosynthesis
MVLIIKMGFFFIIIVFSFIFLFFTNILFVILNLIFMSTNGVESFLENKNFIDLIYFSIFFKWIILGDAIWTTMSLIFILKRKHYKTNEDLHYLKWNKISEHRICIIIPTYNEELIIEKLVKNYLNENNVIQVLVIDNNSNDKTADIAEKYGAKVIRKEKNTGYANSCVMGLKESLKTNANVIVLTEGDGTFDSRDLSKMIPYLENTDMVVGTREIQVLSEKGNQNKMFYVWGNFLLAKLLQIKFFSLLHIGVVSLTDVGCAYRCITREALEKIIDQFTYPNSNKVIVKPTSGLFALFMTMIGLKNDLRIVEIPITFKKRMGVSKTESDKKIKAIKYGLEFFWYILSS